MTRRLLRLVFTLGLFLLASALSSCGENFYNDKLPVTLSQNVYMLPDGYNGSIDHSGIYPIQGATVEKGQSVRFMAVHTLNGENLTSDVAANIYKSILWEIDGEYFNLSSFRYTFKKAGLIEGKLYTVDEYDDILVNDFSIRVNTPEEFTLDYPYDGYNLAEPSKATDLPFRWTLTGIDEWEDSECEVFLSTQPESLYVSRIATMDCQENANLWGPIVGDSAMLYKMGIDLRKESFTFYWTVKYTIISDGDRRTPAYSPVYHFTTKYLNDSLSTLRVPIYYKNFGLEDISEPFKTIAYVVSASGDTLKTYTGTQPQQEILYNLPSQNGVKIYFKELSKKDYKADPIQVDLLPGAVVETAPVYFVDQVPPQVAPVRTTFSRSSDIEFYFYDDGSGIQPGTMQLNINDIPLLSEWSDSLLIAGSYTCGSQCYITIKGNDFAGNILPETNWYMSLNKDNNLYTLERIP